MIRGSSPANAPFLQKLGHKTSVSTGIAPP